jgi:hypothetical protein
VKVAFEPPKRPPTVPESEKGPETERVEVPTEETPLAEVEKSTWLAVMAVEVARPHQVRFELAPPRRAPRVPERDAGKLVKASEEVATCATPVPEPLP